MRHLLKALASAILSRLTAGTVCPHCVERAIEDDEALTELDVAIVERLVSGKEREDLH